jgi:hypothetical protein
MIHLNHSEYGFPLGKLKLCSAFADLILLGILYPGRIDIDTLFED